MRNFPQLNGFKGAPELVRLIGHRGARGLMPENTLEGFEYTLDLDVRALEFDVLISKDNVPVITHDYQLAAAITRNKSGEWLTNHCPKVNELTLSELKQFDVGGLDQHSVYGKNYPHQKFLSGVRIPKLSELLDLVCSQTSKNIYLLLEIKPTPSQNIANVVRKIVAEISEKKLFHCTVLHSFDWDLLKECQRVAPEIACSFLSELPGNDDEPFDENFEDHTPDFSSFDVSIPKAIANLNGQMWCPNFKDVTEELVQEAHDLGLVVCTWTVNETEDLENMVNAGVDGIITDYPSRAQKVLINRGLRW